MEVDRTLINSKLASLKTTIARMEKMRVTEEEILQNEDVQDLLDRRMQLAIENVIDIASNLIAGLNLERPERASDSFLLLKKEGIITGDLAKKMAGAVGLRNIIIHEYDDIDYFLAYSNLEEKLDDIKEFARDVLKFIES